MNMVLLKMLNWRSKRSRCDARRRGRVGWGWVVLLVVAAGCAREIATPTEAPTATFTPVPPSPTATATATPSPTPTPTPEPALEIDLAWPSRVSPLEPRSVAVSFEPVPSEGEIAAASARVLRPDGTEYAVLDLDPADEEGRYVSSEPLRLPLEADSSAWWMALDVDTTRALAGLRVWRFTLEAPVWRDLSEVLPEGAAIRIPEAFETVVVRGDRRAGGRVWAHEMGEVGLWWTPGPAEDLTLTTARMTLDASYHADGRVLMMPEKGAVEAATWEDRPAFRFEERWADGAGTAWVIQSPANRLFVLRVRPPMKGGGSPLLQAIAETFTFRP